MSEEGASRSSAEGRGGIVGVLLAAGRSRRFGADKRFAAVEGGTPMAVAACRNLVAALGDVIAVVRPGDTELAEALVGAGASIAECTDADRGMGRSLACGVRAARAARGFVVTLADMPWIRPRTYGEAAASLLAGAAIVAARHRGRRGHPVGFDSRFRAELEALDGDQGARELLVAHAADVWWLDTDDAGVVRDVDVPDDLRG